MQSPYRKDADYMNKRTLGFVILNIIMDAAEFAGIFFLADMLLGNKVISIVVTALVAILMIAIQLMAGMSVKGIIAESEDESANSDIIKAEFDEICEKLEKEYSIGGLSLVIASGDRINVGGGYTPAFNYKGIIAIANGATPAFRKGLMAHEIGHAVSGLSSYSFLLIRPTHLVASLIKTLVTTLATTSKVKPLSRVAAVILAIPYTVFMIPDLIAVIPFMRADEYAASAFAVSLGYGEELRCAYHSVISSRGNTEVLLDIAHPNLYTILEKMDKQMELADEEKDVYSIGRTVYSVDADAESRAELLCSWYKYRARTTGDGYYCYMLGMASEKGNGCKRDLSLAKEYYERALSLGYKNAHLRLGYLAEMNLDIVSAYNSYKAYLEFNPDDKNAEIHMKDIREKYFAGLYNCRLVSPAGKIISFPTFKSKLEDGALTWIISTGENYNVIKGEYKINRDTIEFTLIMDEDRKATLTSDPIEDRDAITITGAFGKYTLMLTYDEE